MNKCFKKYLMQYTPFPWEIDKNEVRNDLTGKHTLLISYVRYFEVYIQLNKLFSSTPKGKKRVIDFGSYPGGMLKLLEYFFKNGYEYFGVGLGFSEEYKNIMSDLGARLFYAELDPLFCKVNSISDAAGRDKLYASNINADIALFLDTIEHLNNPIDALDTINETLMLGGSLILTTDNISALGYTLHMFANGNSPNVHPLRSSMFYCGEKRPHYREYSKEELKFYLEYCGFQIVEHKYFERKQGDYYFSDRGDLKLKWRTNIFMHGVKSLLRTIFPHLRDHHIILAKKTLNRADVVNKRLTATCDHAESLKIRKEHNLS